MCERYLKKRWILHLFESYRFSLSCDTKDFFDKHFYSLQQSNYNGVSKSVLKLTPGMDDDGRYLTCRADNDALKGTAMEDQWHLKVHCELIQSVYAENLVRMAVEQR